MKLKTKIKRFEKLREWVRAEPRRYNQRYWALEGDQLAGSPAASQNPPCGTVTCLAGGAVLMSGFRLKYDATGEVFKCRRPGTHKLLGIKATAEKLLGLSALEGGRLFSGDAYGWRRGPRDAFYEASTLPTEDAIQGHADAAIAELDIWIATMKRELERKGNVDV